MPNKKYLQAAFWHIVVSEEMYLSIILSPNFNLLAPWHERDIRPPLRMQNGCLIAGDHLPHQGGISL